MTDTSLVDRRTLGAAILIGSCALLVLGVQPVLLGAMVQEGRIGEAQVGNLVTVEMIALAIGSLSGIALLRRLNARALIGFAGLALAGINIGSIGISGMAMLGPARGMAGISEGVLVASALVAIAGVAKVERASALFLAAQTLMQAIVAAMLPHIALITSRTDIALSALAAAGLIAALSALTLPAFLRPADPQTERGAITRASLTALLGAGLFLGAIVSVWSYFGLWLTLYNYPPAFEGTAVALCLVSQVVGALVAARFGERLPNRQTIAACALAAMLLVASFYLGRGSGAAIIAVSMAFGFVWLFTLPFFAGWLIELDPGRRAVLYLTAFQLGGAALLPTLAGFVVDRYAVDAVLLFSGVIFVALSLIAGTLRLRAE